MSAGGEDDMPLKMIHFKKPYSLQKISRSNEISSCNTEESPDTSCKDTITRTEALDNHNPFLGFFYTFLCSLFFISATVFVKKLSYINSSHISFIRNAGDFAGCLPIAVYNVKEVLGPKKDRYLLLLRGFLGATSVYLYFLAYSSLPLTEAAIIMSTMPALTTIGAYVYLKESCTRLQILCLFVTACGVLLSVRLPELLTDRSDIRYDSTYLGGLAAAVGSVFFTSMTCVALRKMKVIHFSVTNLYLGFLGMVENAVIGSLTSSFVCPRCGLHQVFVILLGIFGMIGQCSFALAIQVEAAGIVAAAKSCLDIIVAITLQIIIFDAGLDVYNIIGAVLVILSMGVLGFDKWLGTLPEGSVVRRKLKYLL